MMLKCWKINCPIVTHRSTQEREVSDKPGLGDPTRFNDSLFKSKLQANKKA